MSAPSPSFTSDSTQRTTNPTCPAACIATRAGSCWTLHITVDRRSFLTGKMAEQPGIGVFLARGLVDLPKGKVEEVAQHTQSTCIFLRDKMIDNIYLFILDENNRNLLTWFGSGIAAVICGIWVVYTHFASRNKVENSTSSSEKVEKEGENSERERLAGRYNTGIWQKLELDGSKSTSLHVVSTSAQYMSSHQRLYRIYLMNIQQDDILVVGLRVYEGRHCWGIFKGGGDAPQARALEVAAAYDVPYEHSKAICAIEPAFLVPSRQTVSMEVFVYPKKLGRTPTITGGDFVYFEMSIEVVTSSGETVPAVISDDFASGFVPDLANDEWKKSCFAYGDDPGDYITDSQERLEK